MSSQANEPEIEYDNLLDYFQFYLLPLAITFGMTPEQFWEDNPDDLWAYWDAYEMKRENEEKQTDINNYNLGQYFMLAIAQCFQDGKKQIYPKKPFTLSKNNNKQFNSLSNKDYEELRKVQLKQMVDNFNKK